MRRRGGQRQEGADARADARAGRCAHSRAPGLHNIRMCRRRTALSEEVVSQPWATDWESSCHTLTMNRVLDWLCKSSSREQSAKELVKEHGSVRWVLKLRHRSNGRAYQQP